MKLGENGVAFFAEPTTDADVPEYLVTSPVPGSDSSPVDGEDLAARIKKIHQGLPHSRHTKSLSECSSSYSASISREPSCELDSQHRKSLPFKASLFSQRSKRSLPNLTELIEDHGQRNNRKNANNTKLDTNSHSVAMRRSLSPPNPTFRMRNSNAFMKSRRKLSSSTNEESDVDEAGSAVSVSSASSDQDHLKIPGIVMTDGALSDSELDLHRDTTQPHKSDVVMWKWGELPKTREETEKAKTKQESDLKAEENKAASTWGGWFPWSRSKPSKDHDQGVYLDDLVRAVNDPSKIEKYLRMSPPTACSSPPYDSGNGSVTGSNFPSKTIDIAREGNNEQQMQPTSLTENQSKESENKQCSNTKNFVPHSTGHESTSENHEANDRKTVRSITPSSDIFLMSDEEADNAEPCQRNASTGGISKSAGVVSESTGGVSKYIRSLRLSSNKLKKLGLRLGANEARFSITTKFQGTTWCSCHIYLYKWTERLVISDIDGTITKSDVLGHVIPAIGGQWAHAGVAELYTRIKENGYQLVYLSSRAIGQSYSTKKYLQSIAQNAKFLPDGPLLLSPTSVLMAFRREVIDRKPEEFKIAALTDLKECFPVKRPFYAGFGNRETDVVSYRAVDIPPDRILIIDKQGRVRRADSIGYETSFMSLATETVDYIFPPLTRRKNTSGEQKKNSSYLAPSFFKSHGYSDFTYWQTKAGSVAYLDDKTLENYEGKRTNSRGKRKKK
ncbi:unnamed protein product [Thelazia callipaeda]|uniref:LNS2 domain-containing protein n=1 Tax=Thelazia callipaeda TaxID=103827 RepID=A0A0N5CPC7_THECL|nr:unnamed protein product [Thelazia callipaeda]